MILIIDISKTRSKIVRYMLIYINNFIKSIKNMYVYVIYRNKILQVIDKNDTYLIYNPI